MILGGIPTLRNANVSKDAFKNLEIYGPWPADDKVIAWPVERTSPEPEGKPSIQVTIKAQLLHETEEGRQARLQREKEEEEERLRLEKEEEEARIKEEEEAAQKKEGEEKKSEAGEEADGTHETPSEAVSVSDAITEEAGASSSHKSGSEAVNRAEKDEL
jgi:translation initiation factor 4G